MDQITSNQQLDELESKVIAAAKRTIASLHGLLSECEPIDVFAHMKFGPAGSHPTDERFLNLIEQFPGVLGRTKITPCFDGARSHKKRRLRA